MIMTLTIGLLSFCYDIIANRDRGTALRRPGPVAAPVTGSVHGRASLRQISRMNRSPAGRGYRLSRTHTPPPH